MRPTKKKHHLIGKYIGGTKIVGFLGRGGNAEVFKVTDGRGNMLAMKLLKVHNGKAFEKKYSRFKDEIEVVIKHQTTIKGIIPIINSYLPNKPDLENRPWYTMPIAMPISKWMKEIRTTDEIIGCIQSLSLLLDELHNNNIVHRDIKPSNIYLYNNIWCFGDFGLVDYPDKQDLTTTFESVGPKSTIAPEMKRDAKNSDGKKADIYSLAKTLWVLLTGKELGFDGQYSHSDPMISLNTFRNDEFLITLHQLLEKSTSTSPNERPTAIQFYQSLSTYINLKDNFKKSNIQEWEFVIRSISPISIPSEISWSDPSQIVIILKLLSSVKSLNHMFMPDGGGMDLLDCNISNNPEFIELNFGSQYIVKLKPKKMTLNLFKANFEWNYFLLETETISPSGVYTYTDISEVYNEPLLELSKDEYVESYHLNYGVYNGNALPSTAREVYLGLKGSYCIFAKGSTYNSIPDTYSAYQNKMSAKDFRKFIERSISELEFAAKHPEIIAQRREQREHEKRMQREIQIEKFRQKEEALRRKWENILNNIQMPSIPPANSNPDFLYSLILDDQHFETNYYISNENKIIEYDKGTFRGMFQKLNHKSECLLFTSFEDIKSYIEILKERLFDFEDDSLLKDLFLFDIHIHRLKKPANIPSKDMLRSVLKLGDDSKYNRLFIDKDGNFQLCDEMSMGNLDAKQYPVIGERFSAYQNSVGQYAKLSWINDMYLALLSAWYNHLVRDKRQRVGDFVDPDLTEEHLLEKIKTAIENYN
ncbi:serine/threonine protein kinase [Priestia megaterium]|uniref:protein kinase domain-containing protein n=1 Tax=Priestia megaterium TaxID=1404 RepID=UPI00339AFDA1